MQIIKSLVKKILENGDNRLIREIGENPQDIALVRSLSDEEKSIISVAKPFTMTSLERMVSLIHSVKYIVDNEIDGDIAECGVWRGGSMMIIALTLLNLKSSNRSLYLYDTFEGMPEPTEEDKSLDGVSAKEQLENTPKIEGRNIWCCAEIEDVKKNMISTGYPLDRINFIKGKVQDTIPCNLSSNLSLLRLDTDWYESTKHELLHLYPLLQIGGVLIVDDYGHWQGSRKAVDEYFASQEYKVYLHKIDYTGRIAIKAFPSTR